MLSDDIISLTAAVIFLSRSIYCFNARSTRALPHDMDHAHLRHEYRHSDQSMPASLFRLGEQEKGQNVRDKHWNTRF